MRVVLAEVPLPPLTVTYRSAAELPPGLMDMIGAEEIPDPTDIDLLPPEKMAPPVVMLIAYRYDVPLCSQGSPPVAGT